MGSMTEESVDASVTLYGSDLEGPAKATN